jgi:hypothetical protein
MQVTAGTVERVLYYKDKIFLGNDTFLMMDCPATSVMEGILRVSGFTRWTVEPSNINSYESVEEWRR